jgi:phage gp16-like protein
MNDTKHSHDLFSASLETIVTNKRVEKFQRFKNDFQRECTATLDNAQEWIKAELPIVTDYVDAAAVKDELRQSKTSGRRKHLLSALLFEKSLRDAINNNNASTAAIMAMHMFNHMWQAKVELNGTLPAITNNTNITSAESPVADETYNDTREKILTSLIEKGEKLIQDSQIQPQKSKQKISKHDNKPSPPILHNNEAKKKSFVAKKKSDLWKQEHEKAKHQKKFGLAQNKKSQKKSKGMLSKVATKFPLRKNKAKTPEIKSDKNKLPEKSIDDSLLEDPNRSAIMVNPGFSDSIDDSLIQERSKMMGKPNESGVTVHKMIKERNHDRQEPGSNTIIMKLASGSAKRSGANLSVPEKCQQAINILTEQFPGYDMVAIRHMAAEKVGVSPQYIENLNILPEKSA